MSGIEKLYDCGDERRLLEDGGPSPKRMRLNQENNDSTSPILQDNEQDSTNSAVQGKQDKTINCLNNNRRKQLKSTSDTGNEIINLTSDEEMNIAPPEFSKNINSCNTNQSLQTFTTTNDILPRPVASIMHLSNKIVLSWTMEKTEYYDKCVGYQIYGREGSSNLWSHICDVGVAELPMSVAFLKSQERQRFSFVVRAAFHRYGPFSLPVISE